MEFSSKNYIFVERFVSKFVCFKYVCKKILKFTPLWQRLKRWVKLLQMNGWSFVEGRYYFESIFPHLLTSFFDWFSLNSQRRFSSGQPTFVLAVRSMRLELLFGKPGNIGLERHQTLICGQFFACLVLSSLLPCGISLKVSRFLTQKCLK